MTRHQLADHMTSATGGLLLAVLLCTDHCSACIGADKQLAPLGRSCALCQARMQPILY